MADVAWDWNGAWGVLQLAILTPYAVMFVLWAIRNRNTKVTWRGMLNDFCFKEYLPPRIQRYLSGNNRGSSE